MDALKGLLSELSNHIIPKALAKADATYVFSARADIVDGVKNLVGAKNVEIVASSETLYQEALTLPREYKKRSYGDRKPREDREPRAPRAPREINIKVDGAKPKSTGPSILLKLDDFPEGTANKLVATVTKMCPESATISITSRGGILVKCTKGDLEKVEASLKRVKINGKDLELNVRE